MEKPVFTKFSKAIKSSIGLSFSRSGRDNCDQSCRFYQGTCYAQAIERIYSDLDKKLARHYRNGPVWVVNRAIAQWKPVKWARISVDGSLPSKSKFKPKTWRAFVKRLRVLVKLGIDTGAQWHIPVETMARARTYRAALAGLGVVVRRTSQADRAEKLLRFTDHYSWVVAKSRISAGRITEDEKQENIDQAERVASMLRDNGQSGIVCPAINSDSKCGKCTACADSRVQFVLYPYHN